MAIFSNQVWFSNRRAKWRRHQRMNLLQPPQQQPPRQDSSRTMASTSSSSSIHPEEARLFGIRGQRQLTPASIRAGSPVSISRRSSCSPRPLPQPPPLEEISADSINEDEFASSYDEDGGDDISVVSLSSQNHQEEALDLKKTSSSSIRPI